MKKKWAVLFVFLTVLLLPVIPSIKTVNTHETFYIRANGSVDPDTGVIKRNGDVYVLTSDLEGSIFVERDNVVVDGAGYMLHGPGPRESEASVKYSHGVEMRNRYNVTVKNFLIDRYDFGFWQQDSTNNLVTGNTITNSFIRAVYLRGDSNNNILSNNIITTTTIGIAFDPNTGNSILENTITNTTYAISLYNAPNNRFIGNIIHTNKYGISFVQSSNNVLRNNMLFDNEQNLVISSSDSVAFYESSDFIHDIDTSNTVNGKPIYYWLNEHDKIVPSDAGYVGLVNCVNITVQDLQISNNGPGILLAHTTHSKIANNKITNCADGIALESASENNIVHGNVMTGCERGIHFYNSSNIKIYDNVIVGSSGDGIDLREYSTDNAIYDNIIKENGGKAIYTDTILNISISGNSITNNEAGIFSVNARSTKILLSGNFIANNNDFGVRFSGYSLFSSNINVTENIISNNTCGVWLHVLSAVRFTGNMITNNSIGIKFNGCYNNVFRSNNMRGNQQTIVVLGEDLASFTQDMDASNTINGKPVYYWVGVKDKVVPSDAAYVVLVDCVNVTVQGLDFVNNTQGLLLAYTSDSTIMYNRLAANYGNGINLWESNDNCIVGNIVTENNDWGIQISNSSNNLIVGNTITNNENGILLKESNENRVVDNSISDNNGIGIRMLRSSTNTINENYLTNNLVGIELESSPNNVFRTNSLLSNPCNLNIAGDSYVNDIDTSNLIESKPVYYWVSVRDKAVPSDAGYVALVNCTNVTVQNLQLSHNGKGILLVYTTSSTITLNTLTDNQVGIGIYNSSKNFISENYVANNGWGIEVGDSFENELVSNLVAENSGWGIRFTGSQKDNIIYHNNFVNNNVSGGIQVSIDKRYGLGLGNAWDNGSEGNYWSDYASRYPNATEIEATKIGNTVFYINENNQDNYPLMTQTIIPEFSSWVLVVLSLILVSISSTVYQRRLTKK
ncbi:MAG: right-handed parallel beta-helix repeat-containing protein [Candidatus Bathyarchaeota archaeon]|nr:right-handed parallel beta-helix repeat-containing protein [Candidatus Bathyarchaeum sp.]